MPTHSSSTYIQAAILPHGGIHPCISCQQKGLFYTRATSFVQYHKVPDPAPLVRRGWIPRSQNSRLMIATGTPPRRTSRTPPRPGKARCPDCTTTPTIPTPVSAKVSRLLPRVGEVQLPARATIPIAEAFSGCSKWRTTTVSTVLRKETMAMVPRVKHSLPMSTVNCSGRTLTSHLLPQRTIRVGRILLFLLSDRRK